MSFLKDTDHSGSRTHDGGPAVQVVIDDFRLRVSLTFAWARLQIEKFIRLGVSPLQSSTLMQDGEKHFTLLGTRRRVLPARRPITDVFPIPNWDDRARNMRNDN